MTDLAAIEYLQTEDGRRALAAAAGLDLEGGSLLPAISRLRRRLSAEQAAAVLEQAALRRRAERKFRCAADMLFTAEGLEQASGELLARHSAARYRGLSRVADCCCGIGGDSLALAEQAPVDAYDNDPVRLACAAHNATVYGLDGRIRFYLDDVTAVDFGASAVEAIFFDPSRRSDGRRVFSLARYQPPMTLIDQWRPRVPAIGVKVAPGVQREEVVWACEQEFVAEGPDLKEGLLWLGPLATTERRATVLPAGATLASGEPPVPASGEPLAWLYDPSPAVTRAGVVQELAALLGARQLDPRLAYLSAAERVATPFAQAYAIEDWLPFNLKRLKARLRNLNVGRVEVRRRGAPLDPSEMERALRQEGSERRIVFLTRLQGRLAALICRPAAERRGGALD